MPSARLPILPAPDIEVEQTPKLVIAGHDPQLERAVAEALKLIGDEPYQPVPRPEPIDRTSWKEARQQN